MLRFERTPRNDNKPREVITEKCTNIPVRVLSVAYWAWAGWIAH